MTLKTAAAAGPKIAPNGLPYLNNETFRDCKIVLRNLSGRPTKFNAAGGKRNVKLLLDTQHADRLARLGWNVKEFNLKEGETETQKFIEVTAAYPTKEMPNIRPPKIVMVTDRNQTELDAQTVGMLDMAHIKKVDLVFRDFPWGKEGDMRGHKAMIKTMYVTIVEDELDREYSEIPDTRFQQNEPIDEWER